MDVNDFVKNFADQFEETDSSLFTPQTNFHDLDEWDSLVALSVIAMIDEHYGVKIKGEQIRNSVTIEDLYIQVKGNA